MAIWADRSPSLVSALLGILLAGDAFLVLDPSRPIRRLLQCFEHAQPHAVLTIAPKPPLPPEIAGQCSRLHVPILPIPSKARSADDCVPTVTPSGDADPSATLAYVVFTSGSTGLPKGVLGTHAPVAHFLQWHTRTFDLTANDRFAMLAGLSHDPLLRDVFTPLWLGAVLAIPGSGTWKDPAHLVQWLRRMGITVLHLTPAMAVLMSEASPGLVLEDVRWAFFGGDLLAPRHLDAFARIAPNATCVNFYGTTETPQVAGFAVAESGRLLRSHGRDVVPIGKGIDDFEILITGPTGEKASAGDKGDICVRSRYLSLGYVNDPELTRAKFGCDSIRDADSDRVYHTGDAGYYLPDQSVVCLGRSDRQVQIRGARVELGEVEVALRELEEVRDAVVVPVQINELVRGMTSDFARELTLIAYLQTAPGSWLSTTQLRTRLADFLPAEAIPAKFIAVDSFPITENGKVDHRRLPEPTIDEWADDDHDRPTRPPLSSLGSTVAGEASTSLLATVLRVWETILGRSGIPDVASFFELGGDSLMAIQVAHQLGRELGRHLPVTIVFQAPTVQQLVHALNGTSGYRASTGYIGRGSSAQLAEPQVFPLSTNQESMLPFLDGWSDTGGFYNMSTVFRFDNSAIDGSQLVESLSRLGNRHDALRMRFMHRAGLPVQKPGDLCLDWQPTCLVSNEGEAMELLRREAHKSYELDNGRLLRARLLGLNRSSGTTSWLFLGTHHIVSDDWSLAVLCRDLERLYGPPDGARQLPDLPVRYGDYCLWQREERLRGELDALRSFWADELAGCCPTGVPLSGLNLHGKHDAATVSIPISDSLLELLDSTSRQLSCTRFATLLGAYAVTLSRWAGHGDIVVGTPIAGRHHPGTLDMVGFFANSVFTRIHVSARQTFADVVEEVRRRLTAGLAHADLHAVEAMKAAGVPDLYQVKFAIEDMVTLDSGRLQLGTSQGTHVSLPKPKRNRAELSLTVSLRRGAARCQLAYRLGRWSAEEMGGLIGSFVSHLTSGIERPHDRFGP